MKRTSPSGESATFGFRNSGRCAVFRFCTVACNSSTLLLDISIWFEQSQARGQQLVGRAHGALAVRDPRCFWSYMGGCWRTLRCVRRRFAVRPSTRCVGSGRCERLGVRLRPRALPLLSVLFGSPPLVFAGKPSVLGEHLGFGHPPPRWARLRARES